MISETEKYLYTLGLKKNYSEKCMLTYQIEVMILHVTQKHSFCVIGCVQIMTGWTWLHGLTQ